MLLEILITLATGFLLAATVIFIKTTSKTLAARRDFERTSGGLKMLDKFSFWAGHINSLLMADGMLYKIDEAFARFNAKTIGWLYGSKKAAMTIELDFIKRMVVDNQDTERMPLDAPFEEIEVDCILTAKGEQWQRLRRAVAPAFKSNKFTKPNVQREVNCAVGKLIKAIDSKLEAAEGGQIELNMDDYAHRHSLDLVFSCFYKQNNLIDFEAKADPVTELVNTGLEDLMWNPVIRLSVIFPVLKPTVDWLIMKFHPQGGWRRMIMDFVKRQTKMNFEARKVLEESRKTGKSVADEDSFLLSDGTKFNRNMIDHVIDQFYEGKLAKREFFHTAWFLMGAADKSTSDAIAFTIYQLGLHRDIQEKLRQCIRAEGEESEYLTWVLNESLRLLPPAPVGCSRVTSRDYKCEDGIVPKGTFVLTPSYTIHRLPEYWGDDANEFRPERFADTSGFHPLQFLPFGYGNRGCPGREFAMHAMKRLFCELLSRYKFECDPIELRYNAPWLMFLIPNKHIYARISRL